MYESFVSILADIYIRNYGGEHIRPKFDAYDPLAILEGAYSSKSFRKSTKIGQKCSPPGTYISIFGQICSPPILRMVEKLVGSSPKSILRFMSRVS
jgi:hypothetical protein